MLFLQVIGEGSCCGSYNISSFLSIVGPGAHIDTSCDYGSQPDIAQAIAASGIPREQLWITSKLNVENISSDMTNALNVLVLEPLQTTYVDLLLIHHAGRMSTDKNPHPPCFDSTLANTAGTYYPCRLQVIPALQALKSQGLIKQWGVSNWNVRDLTQAYDAYGFYPPINQIEIHPYFSASEVISFCNRHGILVEGYAPFGDYPRAQDVSDPIIAQIAANHSATPGQVILTYNMAIGADIVIPRSHTPAHQVENFNLFTNPVVLSEFEILAIGSARANKTKVYATECQPWC